MHISSIALTENKLLVASAKVIEKRSQHSLATNRKLQQNKRQKKLQVNTTKRITEKNEKRTLLMFPLVPRAHRVALISVSLALSQTPVYTARPRIRG